MKITWFAVVDGKLVPRKGSNLPYKGHKWVATTEDGTRIGGEGVSATALDKLIAAHKTGATPVVDPATMTKKECVAFLKERNAFAGLSRASVEALRQAVANATVERS